MDLKAMRISVGVMLFVGVSYVLGTWMQPWLNRLSLNWLCVLGNAVILAAMAGCIIALLRIAGETIDEVKRKIDSERD